ncbi:MAG: class IV adenylate cyclase [Desulfovibrionaceae bacterium]|nr:class IV adenylate cyclase [Desulfovibrionaceae bacterium]
MSLEIECKYLQVDFSKLKARLTCQNAQDLGLGFEDNLIFDTEDGKLRQAHKLLRLRILHTPEAVNYIVTVKLPRPASQHCKIREEYEAQCVGGENLKIIFESLGFKVVGRYEKLRHTYVLAGVHITLDRMPFGDFVELEGEEAAILDCAHVLNLDKHPQSTKSYAELYLDLHKELTKADILQCVFSAEQRAACLALLGAKCF